MNVWEFMVSLITLVLYVWYYATLILKKIKWTSDAAVRSCSPHSWTTSSLRAPMRGSFTVTGVNGLFVSTLFCWFYLPYLISPICQSVCLSIHPTLRLLFALDQTCRPHVLWSNDYHIDHGSLSVCHHRVRSVIIYIPMIDHLIDVTEWWTSW